ncbi:hypothetical protein LTR50_005537 [Elasticomyces elasticus]|nr:hypothetical protein LTR50_005537 [Elasticomyces elasticus]
MPNDRSALLIGGITHARKEWEQCSALLKLREYPSGSREEFLCKLKDGDYNDVVAVYRSNDSTSVTGPFDKELVQALPSSLRYICHNGAGYDNIDVPACSERGIEISSTPIAVNDATADIAMFLMLGAEENAHTIVESTQRRVEREKLRSRPRSEGQGARDTWDGARAFGMKIQYHNRKPLPADQAGDAKYVSFDDLLRTSDVISLNLALNPSTRHIISKAQFDMMKDGVVVVNTARGPIIDEAALVDALESGKVYSAGLDVFEEEPKIHAKLVENENVVLLPHVGTATWETQRDMELLVLDNLKSAVQGKGLITPIAEQKKK